MPPIVYEGVNGKYEGSLFNGVKFWDNGGKTVELEKFADVLVADHARAKEAPPNSVSWKYVNDCVSKGELVNIEDYRIHQANEPRPAGSTRLAKGTRVDYTKKDEQILVTWVRQQVRAGRGIKGNEIYKDLAARLPPSLPELPPCTAPKASVPEAAAAATPAPERARVNKPTPRTAAPHAQPAAQATPASSVGSTPRRARVPFTEEDDKLIIGYVRDRARAGARLVGNKIYQEFEEEPSAKPQASNRLRDLRQRKKEIDAGRAIQRIWRGYTVRRDLQGITKFQARAQGYLTRASLNIVGGPLTKEQFWHAFNEYNALAAASPVPWVEIFNRTIDFWELWRHATEESDSQQRTGRGVEEEDEKEVDEDIYEMNAVYHWDQELMDKLAGDAEELAGDDQSEGVFVSSPPVVGLKRARKSSGASYFGPVNKRPRFDPSSEIPYTPETRTGRVAQRTPGSGTAAAVQETPSRRSRHQLQPQAQEYVKLEAQEDELVTESEPEEDDFLTRSHQIQAEAEAETPVAGPSRAPLRMTSSANRPRPSIEQIPDQEEEDDSSDAFLPIDELIYQRPRNPRPAPQPAAPENTPHHRTLPASWSTSKKDKGKQPATTLIQTPTDQPFNRPSPNDHLQNPLLNKDPTTPFNPPTT
ncbi:hypothetical protein N0V88_000792 [Collariella sp. IMI 366227]|nr:hypothetical protein N0V88_000792 [Collariella sp. IMI 366227]